MMLRRPGSPLRPRATAIGFTLLAHAAALLLVALEKSRAPRRARAPEPQYVSIWPELRQQAAARPVPRPHRAPPAPIAPQLSEPPEPATSSSGALSVQPPTDWNAAAAQVAARIAQHAVGGQITFGPAAKSLRAPCTPRQFDTETQRMMAERLPEPADPPIVGPDPTANCLVVGGRPMCVKKIPLQLGGRDATGELMKNMRTGKKSASAPSAHVCD